MRLVLRAACAATVLALARLAAAQDHTHTPGMAHPSPAAAPAVSQPGQSAFAALAEAAAILAADPTTDWSKVDLEALRRHLIDMDDVVLRAAVATERVAGGARFTVTGEGRVAGAIRRMATAHAATMRDDARERVVVEEVPGGVRVTVTAAGDADGPAAQRIRGLGFVGWLAAGGHHGPHHLAIARGGAPHHH